MDFTPEEAAQALGKAISSWTAWPYGLEPVRSQAALSVTLQEWRDQVNGLQARRGLMIHWANANGLVLDSTTRQCCLWWLMRRAGRCRECSSPYAGRETRASMWRIPGGARTGRGSERTIPAAISCAPSEEVVWAGRFLMDRYEELAMAQGDDWGFGPQVILYRKDRLPGFTPLATPREG